MYSGLSRLLPRHVSESVRQQTSSPADVTRQRLSEEAWLCSAAAEKYDMGMSEGEGERSSASAASSSPLLLLKPWTRAASGPDNPVVIRWLLNNPQKTYRNLVILDSITCPPPENSYVAALVLRRHRLTVHWFDFTVTLVSQLKQACPSSKCSSSVQGRSGGISVKTLMQQPLSHDV
ncbi:uncharacterized protein V6R79_021132 [Siganus canaliculatus]